jgi:hypothetical protein
MGIKCIDCGHMDILVSAEMEICAAGMWDRTDPDQDWLHNDSDYHEYINNDRFCSEFVRASK